MSRVTGEAGRMRTVPEGLFERPAQDQHVKSGGSAAAQKGQQVQRLWATECPERRGRRWRRKAHWGCVKARVSGARPRTQASLSLWTHSPRLNHHPIPGTKEKITSRYQMVELSMHTPITHSPTTDTLPWMSSLVGPSVTTCRVLTMCQELLSAGPGSQGYLTFLGGNIY